MNKFLHFLIVTAVTILGFILQCTAITNLKLGEAAPNLCVIIVASFGFLLGERRGLYVGVLTGLLTDVFFGPLLGFHALLYAIIGYITGKFTRILYVEDLLFPVVMIGVSDLFYTFFSYVFEFLIRNRLFFADFFLRFSLPEMLLTTVAAFPVYPLLRLLYTRVLREKSSSELMMSHSSDLTL